MTEKLQKILKEIESGTRTNLYELDLTQEELLTKDNEGISFLEYLLKYNVNLFSIKNKLINNIEIAYILLQYNELWYLGDFDENMLFSNINGKRFIDWILEKDKLSSRMIRVIKEHIEIIEMLLEYQKEYMLGYLSSELIESLMLKNDEGIYLVEKYLNNEKVLKQIIPLVNDANKLIELYVKYNNYELMKYANETVLMAGYDENRTIFHYLVNEKNIIPEILKNVPDNLNFINFLMENNCYDYLKKASESIQLLEVEPGKTLLEILIEKGYSPLLNCIWEEETISILNKNNKLDLITNLSASILLQPANDLLGDKNSIEDETFLEYMLDNGYNPILNASFIYDEEVVKILYKKQRPDLLLKAASTKLFNSTGNSNTYFDYILESIKNGVIKTKISKLFPYSGTIDIVIKYYLIIAKHDMMAYIGELTEDDLLKKYDEKTLLDGLLETDSNLTLNKILTNSVKSKPKIAVILKQKGYEQKDIDVSSKENNFTTEYLNDVQKSLGIGPLYQDGELLLNQLRQLFMSDGKSDAELVEALISGYREALFINYEVNIEEIKNLITVKQQNLDKFFYIRKSDSNYFSPSNGSVFCDSAVVDTVLHETGHALHYYLVQNQVPENYFELTEQARQNPEMLKKVEDYAKKYASLIQQIELLVEEKCKDFFENYYSDEKIEEIRKLLNKSKGEKKEEFKSLGIPDEQLDIILEGMFTVDEYIAHQKRIFIDENVESIIRNEFGSLMAIGDILDAIYEGKLHSSKLKNQQGEKIKRTAGHGLNYYFSTSHGFDEMVANFSSMSKSKDSKEMLELLRTIVGDELYNMLSEFYYQNIVYTNQAQLETGKGIGGK